MYKIQYARSNFSTLPAGRYYVGDLFFVLQNKYVEFCKKSILSDDGHGHGGGLIVLNNGVKVVTFCTQEGDGLYEDQLGNKYSVDDGSIGCIRVEDIKSSKAETKYGQIIEFDSEFDCCENLEVHGVLTFGHILIAP